MGGNGFRAVKVAKLGFCVCVCQYGLVVRVKFALPETLIQASFARGFDAGSGYM